MAGDLLELVQQGPVALGRRARSDPQYFGGLQVFALVANALWSHLLA